MLYLYFFSANTLNIEYFLFHWIIEKEYFILLFYIENRVYCKIFILHLRRLHEQYIHANELDKWIFKNGQIIFIKMHSWISSQENVLFHVQNFVFWGSIYMQGIL